jgi:alkylation response protein AidB-like acyl-CoA dehydrogenase
MNADAAIVADNAVADAARNFLRTECGFDRLRRVLSSDEGWDKAAWRHFGYDLGFAGLVISETDGGSGLGAASLAAVAEELGAVLTPIPWFETAVLAAGLLQRLGGSAYLAQIANGATATLNVHDAIGATAGEPDRPWISNGSLHGTARFVPFGNFVDHLVIVAVENGASVVALRRETAGIRIEAQVSLDSTRPFAHVHFDHVPIENVRVGPAGHATIALEQSMAEAMAVLAAEQVGGMQRTLDETRDYCLQRSQFGRLIGSFQAVKHRLADMKVRLEASRSAVAWALSRLAEQAPDAPTACAAARAFCTEAYLNIAADGIQLHGGIGFTWDHHAHLFFKRARSTATLLGSPAILRERVAASILDARPGVTP